MTGSDGTYELWGAPMTGSTIVQTALALAGLPVRMVRAASWEEGPKLERLKALNPLGQVPVLVLPDGTVMTESAAIILYLHDLRPEAGLVPAVGDPARTAFLRWLVFLVAAIYPTFTFGDDPARWTPGSEEAGRILRRSTDEARKDLWRQVEEAAAPAGPWFLGERFSAIDLYLSVMTWWRPGRDWFRDHAPRLSAIADRVAALPALAEVWAANRD